MTRLERMTLLMYGGLLIIAMLIIVSFSK